MMRNFTVLLVVVIASCTAVQGRSLMAPAPALAPFGSKPAYFSQPTLPYAFSAMEPYIDALTMQLHWTKHVATYYADLNAGLVAYPALQQDSIATIISQLGSAAVPGNTSATKPIRNGGGGVFNHHIYFKNLAMPTAQSNATNNTAVPQPLAGAINSTFGSLSNLKANMTAAGLGVFGSGWAWLTVNPKNGSLGIETTPNQDNTLSTGLGYSGNIPILGVDVWEHAYYLKHYNVRAAYISDWWDVVNWDSVNANYQAALKNNLSVLTTIPQAS